MNEAVPGRCSDSDVPGGMETTRCLSLRENADSTKRESAPPAVLADISAAGIVIAGSVSWITPVSYVGGAGPIVQLAFSSQGWGCVGGGLTLGTVGKAYNFGPLTGGDLGNARNILSGFSVSSGLQPVPYYGMQETANSSGWLYGPTGGTIGASISGTYSFCGSEP